MVRFNYAKRTLVKKIDSKDDSGLERLARESNEAGELPVRERLLSEKEVLPIYVQDSMSLNPMQNDYWVKIPKELSGSDRYSGRIDEAKQDFTGILDKSLDIWPVNWMGGVYGFTYLGSGKMTRREDLFGDMALMVDVHEAGHTPWEYETRVRTDWKLVRLKPKYVERN